MKYDIDSINKRKQQNKVIKTVIDVILVILIYNIVLISISCMNKISEISLFGCKSFIITTNSMEPSIHIGDVVVVRKCKEQDLKEGDIVSFKQNNVIITHRVTKIEEAEGKKQYITKGDNNNIEDNQTIEYENIIGKKVIQIPYLGNIMKVLENEIVFLVIVLTFLILYFCKIRIKEKKDNRREKKKIEEEKYKIKDNRE